MLLQKNAGLTRRGRNNERRLEDWGALKFTSEDNEYGKQQRGLRITKVLSMAVLQR